MGRSLGVLHTSGPVGQVPTAEQVGRLAALGIQAGARIGTVRAFERTQVQARTDSLTGLSNRRSLEQAAHGVMANKKHFAFVLADLDYFKRLNDSHGHEAGDKALRLFADVLRKTVRDTDLPARWGGEEFAIFFPGANAQQALEVIERLRADLAQALLISQSVPFTASFGVADSSMGPQLEDVVRVADDALYRSKHAGRDRATIGDPKLAQTGQRPASDQRAAIDLKMLVHEN
jgi:diguanylate cyclase (GGDEF)-like protein